MVAIAVSTGSSTTSSSSRRRRRSRTRRCGWAPGARSRSRRSPSVGYNLLLDQFASVEQIGAADRALQVGGRRPAAARSTRSTVAVTRSDPRVAHDRAASARRRLETAPGRAQARAATLAQRPDGQNQATHHDLRRKRWRPPRPARSTARPTRSPRSSRRCATWAREYVLLNSTGGIQTLERLRPGHRWRLAGEPALR